MPGNFVLSETYTLPTSQPFELCHQIAVGSNGSKTRLARDEAACTPCLQSLRAAKQLYLEDETPFDLAPVPEKDFLAAEATEKVEYHYHCSNTPVHFLPCGLRQPQNCAPLLSRQEQVLLPGENNLDSWIGNMSTICGTLERILSCGGITRSGLRNHPGSLGHVSLNVPIRPRGDRGRDRRGALQARPPCPRSTSSWRGVHSAGSYHGVPVCSLRC